MPYAKTRDLQFFIIIEDSSHYKSILFTVRANWGHGPFAQRLALGDPFGTRQSVTAVTLEVPNDQIRLALDELAAGRSSHRRSDRRTHYEAGQQHFCLANLLYTLVNLLISNELVKL